MRVISILPVCMSLLIGLNATMASAASSTLMRYTTPAGTEWLQAMPVGSGRLGAMVFGNVSTTESIQFNEDTLWVGEPHDYSHAGAASHLASIRNNMFSGNVGSASSEITTYFLSVPLRQEPYQPFGNLNIGLTGHSSYSNYERTLDLDQGIVTVQYRVGSVNYTREVFASHPDEAIVIRLTADQAGSIGFLLAMDRIAQTGATKTVAVSGSDRIVLSGRLPFTRVEGGRTHTFTNPLWFEAQVRVVTDGGTITQEGNGLRVQSANSATLFLVAATNYVDFEDVSGDQHARCENYLTALNGISYETLKAAHVADYRGLFRRASIELGTTDPAIANLTIPQRLSGFNVNNDPDLVEMYFNFGRYLLISSSRPGDQPANLEGIWNYMVEPSWECKYTTNINVEMNYWPAEVTNLAECHEPLFDMIDELTSSGHRVAQTHYNADGWVVHHNTDHWRGAAPINNATDGCYPASAAWLCQHLWWHYEYSGDQTFLANRAYPVMRSAAEFYLDYLVQDPRPAYNNWLVTNPSNSPEHGGLVISPTMDNQIIREFFRDTVAAAEILGVDSDLRTTLTQTIARIPPNLVGSHGQLQEWLEDVDNMSDTHRHISHLWGLYPGEDINRNTTAFFNAARVSLQARGIGTSNTGWALAHRLTCWARQLDGTMGLSTLRVLLKSKTHPNLFNNGGGYDQFQIDGNFGGIAGIAEMLLQSHAGEISFIPALPTLWPAGAIHGLRARGGLTTDFAWETGNLTSITLRATLNRDIRLRVPPAQPIVAITLADTGSAVPVTHNADGTDSLSISAGNAYVVWFTEPPDTTPTPTPTPTATPTPTPTPTATPTPTPTPALVTDINRPGYITDVLQPGKLVYGDRSYVFNSPIPAGLVNQMYIRTLNEDRDLTGDDFLTFDVTRPADIYVALRKNISPPPDWLASWTLGTDVISASDGGVRRLYGKTYQPGPVSLGANRDPDMPTEKNMYSVVIVPLLPTQATDWMLHE